MKKILNQKGFSLVETMVAAGILSIVGLAFMRSSVISFESQKSVEDKSYMLFMADKLKKGLADSDYCKDIFISMPWDNITSQDLTMDGQEIDVKYLAHFYTSIYQEMKDEGFPNSLRFAPTTVLKKNFSPPPAEVIKGFLYSESLEVNFSLKNFADPKATRLTLKPITVVFVFDYSDGSRDLHSCYTRGSGLISQERELCHSLGGFYTNDGCRFSNFPGNPGNYASFVNPVQHIDNYRKLAGPSDDVVHPLLCELDKKVIEIEDQEIPAIMEGSTVIIPKIDRTDSATRYCEIPVKNF